MSNNAPINRLRIGNITMSVFQNQYGNSFTFQKSYKDKSGEWKNTDFYNENDLPVIRELIQQWFWKYANVQQKLPANPGQQNQQNNGGDPWQN